MSEITKSHLFYTVMGQKAVFSALFEGYISQKEEDANSDKILHWTNKFTDEFNIVYDKLHPSDNHDECFFGIHHKVQSKATAAIKYGNIGREFWLGIIRKFNGELDYGITAVRLLKSIIIYLIDYTPGEEETPGIFKFTMRKEIIKRHRNILRKIDDELEEDEAEKIATKLVKIKENSVKHRLT